MQIKQKKRGLFFFFACLYFLFVSKKGLRWPICLYGTLNEGGNGKLHSDTRLFHLFDSLPLWLKVTVDGLDFSFSTNCAALEAQPKAFNTCEHLCIFVCRERVWVRGDEAENEIAFRECLLCARCFISRIPGNKPWKRQVLFLLLHRGKLKLRKAR